MATRTQIKELEKSYEGAIYRGTQEPNANILCLWCYDIYKVKDMHGSEKYPICPFCDENYQNDINEPEEPITFTSLGLKKCYPKKDSVNHG